MTDEPAWPKGGGEMGAMIRAHDWAATPIGSITCWPERLKTAIDICLRSALPSYVWWGPDLLQFYNDASLAVNRAKHPASFAAPAREAWLEIWPTVSQFAETVMSTGEPVLGEDLPLRPNRGALEEEAFFTFSYSAIPGSDGATAGIYISAIETTSRVSADRRFRKIFAASPAPLLVLASDPALFTITEVNDAFLRVSGRSGGDLIGRPLFEAFPENPAQPEPSAVPNLRASLERAIASRAPDAMPVQRYDISGPEGQFQERYWKPTNTPLLDGAGDVIALIHHVEDVTEPHRAEQALRESEERYRLIVENARDYAIIITDPDDRIVEWLPGAEAVFGWTAEEAIGQPSAITFTPTDRAQGAPEWEVETAAREGHAPDVRWHQRKDGGQVFIEGMMTPLRNEDGSIRGYLKIGQDVSERRSAQEALEASERRMRSLVTGIPQLVFRSLSSGHRIWGSPQWIEYSGLSFEESLGFGWLDALHPDDRQASMDAWEGVGERGEYYVEHRIRNAATGEYRWHQTRAVPSGDEQGRLEWLGTSSDVEELRRLYRHQQTLLAELQHRVRNTLGVIRSIARRTAETSDNVEDMAMHLDGRLGAFSRVQTLVTRTPDAGVDLTGLIEDELLAHATREGKGLRIQGPDTSLKPRPAETVSLAIHELATNAVKYGALSAKRGQIDVRWERLAREDAEWLELVWEEMGLDLPSQQPERQGFGLELLTRTLPYDLRAETKVEFRREGLRFSMALPLGPDVLAE